jgi:hypothetical protein
MSELRRVTIGPAFPYRQEGSFTTFALDGTTDQWEVFFEADEAATITKLGFRYGLRTGTPPTYKISLQGSSAGNPDGTIKGGGTPASKTFTPPADTTWDGTWQWITLDNAYTCTRGEKLFIVIAYDSGTITAGVHQSTFTTVCGAAAPSVFAPYVITNNATSRTRVTTKPVFGYASASRSYGNPMESMAETAVTTDEWVLVFTYDSGWGDTFKVMGIQGLLRVNASTCDVLVNLYDTDGETVLQTVTVDGDEVSSAGNTYIIEKLFTDATLASLTFGSTYRIGFSRSSGASSFILFYVSTDTSAEMAAFPLGDDVYLEIGTTVGLHSSRTAHTNRRLMMGVMLSEWTEPAASSAGGFIM